MNIGNLGKIISPPFVAGLLGSGLGGPVAAIMGGMGGGQLGPLKQLLQGLQGLFGKSQGLGGGGVSQRPLPFSPGNININISLNPLGALQQQGGAGAAGGQGGAGKANAFANPFQQLMQMLQKLMQALGGKAPGGAGAAGGAGGFSGGSGIGAPSGGSGGSSGVGGSGGVSSADSMVSKAGSNIDSMMGQAEKLMASDKPSDQLKGQMMMQRAMRLFEMISKMLEQRSQAQAKAIQAIK